MAWYTAPSGVTCVAAYDAIGAASLADSYTNEANPGTYDAAPGTAPTWAYGTGWTFNGTTQYLTLGGLPATTKPVSWIIRLTPISTGAIQAPIASYNDQIGGLGIDASWGGSGGVRFLKQNLVNIGSSLSAPPASGAGVVLAVTYSGVGAYAHYRNGVADGSGTNNQTFSSGRLMMLSGMTGRFYKGDMAAVACYSGVLTADDVSAITTAMNALPTPEGQPAALRSVFVPGMMSGGRTIIRPGWGG